VWVGVVVPMSRTVRFRLLGSLGVSVDGTSVAIGAPRQRALLALLLLDANRALPSHVLIEGIWGAAALQHPDAALQIVVSRLRNALGPVADRVTSVPGGYRIDVAEDELDVLRARRDFLRAQAMWAQDDYAEAAARADDALSCWNGDALADLRDAPFYDAAHQALDELRLAIYEFRTRSYLRCGRHVEVLGDIDAWVRLDPWRERMRAHQIVALYRAGRRVDALAVYEDLRQCLAQDLGVDPSTFMQELHARVLRQDPTLLARRAGIVAALPAWTPCSLPFVGRAREETLIFDRLRDVAAGSTHMVLVEGVAGIGKSRLALEAARRAGGDAIVLAVDGGDSLRPGLHVLAAALADASSQLSDAELRLCLGHWPGDLAAVVPALRQRLPDLPPPLDGDEEIRAARLRAAVVSWISALSQRAPVFLLVDDIDRAGAALLLLVGAALVDDEPKRVLLVATARSDSADRSSRLDRLLWSLERRDLVDRIELGGIAPAFVERLLDELERPDAATLAAELSLITRGHPYLLGEMLREPGLGAATPSADTVSCRIRQFVLRRVAGLGGPGASLLGIAASVGGEFDAALLTEVSGGTVQSTASLIDQAVDAGLLHVTGLGTFDFVHDLVRRAIAESREEGARAQEHADIAIALERRSASAARIAAQWGQASGTVASRKAMLWGDRAGEDALHDLDPHAAIDWFAFAAERAEEERTRAHLLIRLAGAQCQAGDKSGAETLRAALDIARRLHDSDLLVEAATLSTPIWDSMPALSAGERVSILTDGSRQARDPGTRARLTARLATELVFTPSWRRARTLADAALGEAREHGDASVLTEVLLRHFAATFTPHNLAERRQNADEAVAAAEHDPVARFHALTAAASAAIEAAELDEADAYIHDACTLGRACELPILAYNIECVRAWRAGLAGDLEEAERLVFGAIEIGTRRGVARPEVGPSLQIGSMRWQQDRLGELLPILRTSRETHDAGSEILLARALADFAELEPEATSVLAAAAKNGFADLPLGMLWSGELVVAAETAFLLGCADIGRVVRGLLEPFHDRVAFNAVWVVAPIAYGAALAAAAAGEPDADAFFAEALDVCDRLRAPVLRARTENMWNRVLVARGDKPRPQAAGSRPV